ncbi:MAG TPA: hypothetical protein VEB59_15675 [Gemmatimonadales bacterium]|nr:hypothetical protein [Gemmatimonadales bacterium]
MSDDRYGALRRALDREYVIETVVREQDGGAEYIALERTLRRRVVIRAIDPALAGAERAEAFQHEVRTLATLRHSSLPSVHRASPIEGFLHSVHEHAAGETLEDRLRRGPLTAAEALTLGDHLLGALAELHGKAIAHRDIRAAHVTMSEGRFLLGDLARAGPSRGPDEPASDLHAAATLLARAAGPGAGALPSGARAALARALLDDPGRRWPSAAAFRSALLRPRRCRWTWTRMVGAALAAASLAGVGLYRWLHREGIDPVPHQGQLALVPFAVDGSPPGDPLGIELVRLVRLGLKGMPGVALASEHDVQGWVDRYGGGVGTEWVTAAKEVGARWIAHGAVDRRPGDLLRVRLSIHDSLGHERYVAEMSAPRDSMAPLGDSVSLRIASVVAPRADSLYEPIAGLAAVPLPALRAFLQGEAAFAQDDWARAQEYYEVARAQAPGFALAEWRLANVQRWRRLPYEGGLRELYARDSARLRPRDRRLVEALLEPDLERRFAALERHLEEYPRDAYARLLQADELFHRGPLVGRDLDHAVRALRAAVDIDPSLALAYDHLVLAAVRRRDREAAALALAHRRGVGRRAGRNDIDLLPFLELVYDERFAPLRAWARYRWLGWRTDARTLQRIAQVARFGTPLLDLPRTQLRYCELLLRQGRSSPELTATAHEGRGLALIALGHVEEGLEEIDSAAAMLDTPEARLQRAEWRVVPAALGVPGFEPGRPPDVLESLAGDSAVGAGAAWALAMAARAAGDSALAERWTTRLPAESPLRVLLEALEMEARGRPDSALAVTDTVRLAFQQTRRPDGFAGAAFHLLRARWREARGDRAGADRERLWSQATDVEGWPGGLAQPGEIDAALGALITLHKATSHDREPAP